MRGAAVWRVGQRVARGGFLVTLLCTTEGLKVVHHRTLLCKCVQATSEGSWYRAQPQTRSCCTCATRCLMGEALPSSHCCCRVPYSPVETGT